MKKYLILTLILPFVLCACGKKDDAPVVSPGASSPATSPSASGEPSPSPTDSEPTTNSGGIVGTWKINIAKTTTPTTEKDKAEEASLRLEFKDDGTVQTTGAARNSSGKWTLEGNKVKFTWDKNGGPPEMTIGTDGSLSITSPDGKESMVFEKA